MPAWIPAADVHAWEIAEREYARHEQRRGRRFAYQACNPRTTALVVVDMVTFFAQGNPFVHGIVPQVNSLASAMREAGGLVAWVLPEASEAGAWASEFYGDQVAQLYAGSGGGGTLADRLVPGLLTEEADLVAEKSASSAFFPGRSTLPEQLVRRGVDSVVITGTVTNVCVESSARDAATLGYRTIVVADGCAAPDDRSHNAALHTLYRSFADVRPTADVLAILAAGEPG